LCNIHEILQNKARIIENIYAINSLINIISLNDFENEVHQEFFVFALVAKKVLEKPLEEVYAVLKEFQDVFPPKGP
jgi:hypothetical protein